MSNTAEKTTFGASVDPVLARPAPPHLNTSYSHASGISDFSALNSPSTPTKIERDPSNPFSSSPHTPLHTLGDNHASSKTHLDVYTTDLESGTPMSTTTTINCPKQSVDGRVKECKMSMWPSKQSLIDTHKAGKRQRRCRFDPMRNLTKKQKILVKVLLALVVVALAAGLGVGISRAVGGGIWSGDGYTRTIPNQNN